MLSHIFSDEFNASLIHLHNPNGSTATISPYGAHVLSWVTADGYERLFLSPKTGFGKGVAIRGGVPLIFPQFSDRGALPKHGFARNQEWEVARVTDNSAIFWLSESQASRAVWQHRFLVEYSVRLGRNSLEMILSVTNTDVAPFSFSAALHTYLRVDDLNQARLLGLKGLNYLDSADAGRQKTEESDSVIFQDELDRLYMDAPESLTLLNSDRRLLISAEGFPDAVVWNPGAEKCARLGDMQPDGYLRFVCVEAAAAASPVRLAPGGNWRGTQALSIS